MTAWLPGSGRKGCGLDMDGMAVAVLAFVAGTILGSGGTYVIFAAGRRKKDLAGVTAELGRIDGDLRKMDRNFRLFLEDCKTTAMQSGSSLEKAAGMIESTCMDLHAKLAVQASTMASVDGAVQSLSRMVPERFDVLDAAHKGMGADIGRILDRVRESV